MSDLTPEERVRRADRAREAFVQFVKPELDFAREHYTRRIVEIATQELDTKRRAEMIANLSVALRIHEEIEKGFAHYEQDGREAETRLIRAQKIETFSPAKRRLLNIGSGF